MVDPLPSSIDTDVSNFVPDRSGATGMTSRGFLGAGGNKDGARSVFITQTLQGHLGHLGLWKPLTPTVPLF